MIVKGNVAFTQVKSSFVRKSTSYRTINSFLQSMKLEQLGQESTMIRVSCCWAQILCLTNSYAFCFNSYMTNGFSHHYHLEESAFIFRGVRSDFKFLSHFSMNFCYANRIAPDWTPRSAASHLGLFCLPMSHKKNARLK